MSTPGGSLYGAYPENYKEIVTEWLKMKVPSNTKIGWQSDPKPADLPDSMGRKFYGYLVIFSMDGNNPSAGSTGMRTRAVLIHDGHVIKANGFDR